MYDFLRPGVSVANADLRTALSSSLLCNSSGIGYSEGKPILEPRKIIEVKLTCQMKGKK